MCLLPWIGYMALSIYFFHQVLVDNYWEEEASDSNKVYHPAIGWVFSKDSSIAIGCSIVVLIIYQLILEFLQARAEGLIDYLWSFFNINDLFQYFATLWIVVLNLVTDPTPEELSYLRVLACFVVLSQAIKAILDWLRLFKYTSFYVTLIT